MIHLVHVLQPDMRAAAQPISQSAALAVHQPALVILTVTFMIAVV